MATSKHADTLQATISFLSDPRSYPGSPATVERMETHGAHVFLAGAEAFKIKKPVKFSYMDFSTLPRRRRACERELALNRPHAPGIYLGLVAIVRRKDGQLAFGGPGQVIEWAVHMRRFDQAALLSSIAGRGPLELTLCEELADAVNAFHATAQASRKTSGSAQMSAITRDVVAALKIAKILPQKEVRALAEGAKQEIARTKAVLDRRAATGYMRRCHGDLHLGNIVLWNGVPVLFDALEFDEDMATIDTLYDLAFLIMDLEHRMQRQAANSVLNRYLWRQRKTNALTGLAALPLFLSLRAAIRAMVRIQQAAQRSDAKQKANLAEARDYLASAIRHLSPPPPRLVAIGGLSGTGKSTLGTRLAPYIGATPGALHLRSDLERKALFGKEPTERLPAKDYGPEIGSKIYHLLGQKALAALKCGHSVIVDAVFADEKERDLIETTAHRAKAPFHGIWLEAPQKILKRRVSLRRNDASDATEDVVDKQLRYDLGTIRWSKLSAGGRPDDVRAAAQLLIANLES